MTAIKTYLVQIDNSDAKNLIFGQTHFIKTVEDLHEALVTAVPNIRFGIAFCEASGPRLIRTSGTDAAMEKLATENAQAVGCGHTFFIFLEKHRLDEMDFLRRNFNYYFCRIFTKNSA